MDDDRQIEAELQHSFNLLACSPPKLLDRSSKFYTILWHYLRYKIMHKQGVSAFPFRTPEQRVKVVDFDVAKMLQK